MRSFKVSVFLVAVIVVAALAKTDDEEWETYKVMTYKSMNIISIITSCCTFLSSESARKEGKGRQRGGAA